MGNLEKEFEAGEKSSIHYLLLLKHHHSILIGFPLIRTSAISILIGQFWFETKQKSSVSNSVNPWREVFLVKRWLVRRRIGSSEREAGSRRSCWDGLRLVWVDWMSRTRIAWRRCASGLGFANQGCRDVCAFIELRLRAREEVLRYWTVCDLIWSAAFFILTLKENATAAWR